MIVASLALVDSFDLDIHENLSVDSLVHRLHIVFVVEVLGLWHSLLMLPNHLRTAVVFLRCFDHRQEWLSAKYRSCHSGHFHQRDVWNGVT